MKFRFETENNKEMDLKRRQTRLRMLCFFMTVVMLCSGCGSIILSGNLEFSANAPITPMPASQWDGKIPDVTFGYQKGEKYNIGGIDAFTVLPGHLCPADVPKINEKIQEVNANIPVEYQKKQFRSDFKVIDYNENTGCFVYAYFTPYLRDNTRYTNETEFPEIVNTGLKSNVPRSGSAKNFQPTHAVSDNELDGAVLVLMSSKPGEKEGDAPTYKVFFSCAFTQEEIEQNDNRCLAGMAGMDMGIDESEVEEAGGMTPEEKNESNSQKNYYVYCRDRLYLFTEDGKLIFSSDYHAIVENKAREMASRYGNFKHYRYTVSNVEMDGKGIPYITLDMEASNKEFSTADKDADDFVNNDKEYDEEADNGEGDAAETVGDVTYFHGSFSCLRAPIGGTNGINFRSYLTEEAYKNLTDVKITVEQEEHDYYKERRKDILVEAATSENAAKYREETYDEVLARLLVNPKDANDYKEQTEADILKKYLERTDVQNWLSNGFTGYDTGDADIKYVLSGSANGRVVPMYNSSNAQVDPFLYKTNSSQYEHYYFFDWFSYTVYVNYDRRDLQASMVGALASNLNWNNYHLDPLKPGLYGGRDWAYYRIGNHTESNTMYSVSGCTAILGNAQPLVSSKFFNHFDGRGNVNEFSDAGGSLTVDAYGVLRYGDSMPSEWSMRGSRYYYNGTVDGNYSVAGGFHNSSSASANQSFNMDYMLRNSLPFVVVRKESKDSKGKVLSTYLTVNNDYGSVYILPTQVLECTKTVDLEYQYILKDDGDNRSDCFHKVTTKLVIPSEYKMEFPVGSYIELNGDTWVGNNVKAGDAELTALTWYTVSGERLAQNSVWSWVDRAYYPIFDNASQQSLNTVERVRYRGWWWWYEYYYLTNEFWDFYRNNKNSYFSTLQVERQGKNSLLYDRLVPGQAQDVGIWKVGDQDIVAYFTDQVIRFYKESNDSMYGSYRAKAEVRIDELRSLTTGYIMKEEENGDAQYQVSQNTGRQSTDGTAAENSRMAAMGEEALNEDEAMYKLDSTNILPTDSELRQFLYYSNDGGLYLLQLVNSGKGEAWQKQGRIMSLMDGTYYRIFKGKGSTYKVVGFQTKEYSYTGADLCMAKVYDLDMSRIISERGSSAIDAYLESLRNIYQIRTHTLRNTTDASGNVTVEIVKPDENDTEYQRAKKILVDNYESVALPELQKICKEYSIDVVPGEAKDYLKQLRETYSNQQKAISEMYRFLGIDATQLKDNWRYLQFEGRLFNASYESLLEQTMVEIVLSKNYLNATITPRSNGLDGMVGVHKYDPAVDGPREGLVFADAAKEYVDEFAEYRDQYALWQMTTKEQQIMAAYTDDVLKQRNQELSASEIQGTLDNMATQEETSELQGMDFYKAVSDELEEIFYRKVENGEIILKDTTGDK